MVRYINCLFCNFLILTDSTGIKVYCPECKEWTYLEGWKETFEKKRAEIFSKK